MDLMMSDERSGLMTFSPQKLLDGAKPMTSFSPSGKEKLIL
jgi:hypothetical protein